MALLNMQIVGKKDKLAFVKWFMFLRLVNKGRGGSSGLVHLLSTPSHSPRYPCLSTISPLSPRRYFSLRFWDKQPWLTKLSAIESFLPKANQRLC